MKKRYPCRVVGGGVAEDLFERGLGRDSSRGSEGKGRGQMAGGDLDRVIETILNCKR